MSAPSPFTEPAVGALLGEEELDAIRRVLASGDTLNRGKDVDAFEQEFAAYCGAPHAVAVSSCTAALRIAVQVLRLRKGDEVIVPANAFWNTVVALVEKGVTIRVADVDGYSLGMDAAHAESLMNENTKAIFILSIGGNPCDMRDLRAVADRRGIPIVEDAAHSAGSVCLGKNVGSLADISCFSFSTLKNMTTLGEGGMFVSTKKEYADDARKFRECWPVGHFVPVSRTAIGPYPKPEDAHFMRPGDAYGAEWQELEDVGTNYKMSSAAAAVGRVQLKKLDAFNATRRSMAKQYDEAVGAIPGVRLLRVHDGCDPSWHLYHFFLTEASGVNRDACVALLKEKYGIQLINRFWPIHLHNVLRLQGHGIGEAPVYERLWFSEMMSLPIGPRIDAAASRWMLDAVADVCSSLRAS